MKDEREIDTKELSKSKRKTPKNNDFIENKKKKLLESWHKKLKSKTNKNQTNKKGNKT